MKNIQYKFLLAVLVSLMGCKSCKKDPDPCKALKPTSADFTISEPSFGKVGWITYDTDTLFAPYLEVTAVDKEITDCTKVFTWFIGNQRVSGYKMSSVYRERVPTNSLESVTLVLKKSPNTACFPNDNGMDTVTRQFVCINDIKKCKWFGRFQGYNTDAPTDTFTINIEHIYAYPPENKFYDNSDSTEIFKIHNFPSKGCGIASYYSSYYGDNDRFGFRQFLATGDVARYSPKMPQPCIYTCMVLGKVENNQLTIDYYTIPVASAIIPENDYPLVDNKPYLYTKKQFKGKRL